MDATLLKTLVDTGGLALFAGAVLWHVIATRRAVQAIEKMLVRWEERGKVEGTQPSIRRTPPFGVPIYTERERSRRRRAPTTEEE